MIHFPEKLIIFSAREKPKFARKFYRNFIKDLDWDLKFIETNELS